MRSKKRRNDEITSALAELKDEKILLQAAIEQQRLRQLRNEVSTRDNDNPIKILVWSSLKLLFSSPMRIALLPKQQKKQKKKNCVSPWPLILFTRSLMENDINDCSVAAKIDKRIKRNKLQHVDDNNIVAVVAKLKAVSQQKILYKLRMLY